MDLSIYEKLKNSFKGVINTSIKNSKTIDKKAKDSTSGTFKIDIPLNYNRPLTSSIDTQYSICVFDLDNTLLDTDLFEKEREESKYNSLNIDCFIKKLNISSYKVFFSEELLLELQQRNPNVKFVVFTRSTAPYAHTVLSHVYSKFNWDLVVTREMVTLTKPNTDGLRLIMKTFKETDPRRLLIIGDSDIDVRVAYYNNSISLLTDWFANKRKTEHWKAINLLPDGIITEPNMLFDILKSGVKLLNLESKMDNSKERSKRFGVVSHFFPIGFNSIYKNKPFNINVSGRYFSSVFSDKKLYHTVTRSILENKESTLFPKEWIESISDFILDKLISFNNEETIVTVIPHRPNREPRLEFMLEQLSNFVKNKAGFKSIIFSQDLLKFKEGVLSQHNDHLDQQQRFKNIETHLYVNRPELVKNRNIIVIDDVVTTGASLMYASIYLKDTGANEVSLFALAQTISK